MKSNSRDGNASFDSVEFRTADDVVGLFAFALEQQIGLADGVGLGVDLLAVEVDRTSLPCSCGKLAQRLLGDGQHAARAAAPS